MAKENEKKPIIKAKARIINVVEGATPYRMSGVDKPDNQGDTY